MLKEDSDVILSGDMNAHIETSPYNNDTDSLGHVLKEEFVIETGLEMIVKKVTHQEIRNGQKLRGRCIDHVYTNISHQLKNLEVQEMPGSHHSLVIMTLTKETQKLGPR